MRVSTAYVAELGARQARPSTTWRPTTRRTGAALLVARRRGAVLPGVADADGGELRGRRRRGRSGAGASAVVVLVAGGCVRADLVYSGRPHGADPAAAYFVTPGPASGARRRRAAGPRGAATRPPASPRHAVLSLPRRWSGMPWWRALALTPRDARCSRDHAAPVPVLGTALAVIGRTGPRSGVAASGGRPAAGPDARHDLLLGLPLALAGGRADALRASERVLVAHQARSDRRGPASVRGHAAMDRSTVPGPASVGGAAPTQLRVRARGHARGDGRSGGASTCRRRRGAHRPGRHGVLRRQGRGHRRVRPARGRSLHRPDLRPRRPAGRLR